MLIQSFPGCCTAGVLLGFGGSETASYGDYSDKRTEEQLFTEIETHLKDCHRRGWALVFAATTGQQERVNRVLPRVGFQKIDETAKANHREYPLIGWVFRLNPSDKVEPLVVPKNPFVKPRPVDMESIVQEDNARAISRIFGEDDVNVGQVPRVRIRPAENAVNPILAIPQPAPVDGVNSPYEVVTVITDWRDVRGITLRHVNLRDRRTNALIRNWVEIAETSRGRGNPFDRNDNETRIEVITSSGVRFAGRLNTEWNWNALARSSIAYYRNVTE